MFTSYINISDWEIYFKFTNFYFWNPLLVGILIVHLIMSMVEDLGATLDIENDEALGTTNANFVDDGIKTISSSPKPKHRLDIKLIYQITI